MVPKFDDFLRKLRNLLDELVRELDRDDKHVEPEVFFPSNQLPPGAMDVGGGGSFRGEFVQRFGAESVLLTRVARANFSKSGPPPSEGESARYQFQADVAFELSFDGGETWKMAQGRADVDVRVDWNREENGKQFFDAEILKLDIADEVEGVGFMFRVSPKVPSTGVTTIRSAKGGYLISAFFDVWSEISVDRAKTWETSDIAGHMELVPTETKPAWT